MVVTTESVDVQAEGDWQARVEPRAWDVALTPTGRVECQFTVQVTGPRNTVAYAQAIVTKS